MQHGLCRPTGTRQHYGVHVREIASRKPIDQRAITEDLGDNFSSWRRLAAGHAADGAGGLPVRARENLGQLTELEGHWPAAATGSPLAHTDLRADNILLAPHAVVVVDWPYAVSTTAWMDALMLLPSVAAVSAGLDPERVWRGYRHAHAIPDNDVNAVLAAIAGDYLASRCAPPRPTSLVYAPTSAPRGWPR